jgi:polyphosphate glucokinase
MTDTVTAAPIASDAPPAASRPLPLGIDVGGSGVKGAPVDLATGEFAAPRLRIDTPMPSTPKAVAKVVAAIAEHFAGQTGDGPVGVTVPGIVANGVVRSAANIDDKWLGTDADALFSDAIGRPVHAVNDADAAGLAEVKYGAAKDRRGLVLVTTLGTGIGTALIYDGVLVPNSEFGHLEIDGHDAESRAAARVREESDLTWPQWGKRLTRYYEVLEFLLSPDLFVVGGGVSKRADKFLPHVKIRTPIVPAQLLNTAGIVGAAWLAAHPRDRTAAAR